MDDGRAWDDGRASQQSALPGRGLDTKVIPGFDGDMTKWPDYEKKVALFQLLDTGPPSKRGPMLMMLLTDKAWEAASEALDPEDIAVDGGV